MPLNYNIRCSNISVGMFHLHRILAVRRVRHAVTAVEDSLQLSAAFVGVGNFTCNNGTTNCGRGVLVDDDDVRVLDVIGNVVVAVVVNVVVIAAVAV